MDLWSDKSSETLDSERPALEDGKNEPERLVVDLRCRLDQVLEMSPIDGDMGHQYGSKGRCRDAEEAHRVRKLRR